MISKDDLRSLIKRIIQELGVKNQEAVSEGAGYKPKTLTQRLSNGEDLEAVYNQLILVYGSRLNKSTTSEVQEDAVGYGNFQIDASDIKNILATLANLSQSHKDISQSNNQLSGANNRLSIINEQMWQKFNSPASGSASQPVENSEKDKRKAPKQLLSGRKKPHSVPAK